MDSELAIFNPREDRSYIASLYRCDGPSHLRIACDEGNLSLIEKALNEGENVNEQDCFQQTVLHYAVLSLLSSQATERHKDVVVYLLEHGADVDSQDKLGWTPLHMAVSECSSNKYQEWCIKTLIERGADLWIVCLQGWDVLGHCMQYEKKYVIIQAVASGQLQKLQLERLNANFHVIFGILEEWKYVVNKVMQNDVIEMLQLQLAEDQKQVLKLLHFAHKLEIYNSEADIKAIIRETDLPLPNPKHISRFCSVDTVLYMED